MSIAVDDYTKKSRMIGSIYALQDSGKNREDIIDYNTKKYDVSREYVEELMDRINDSAHCTSLRKGGSLAGKLKNIADDFNDTPEGFEGYMETDLQDGT